MAKLVHNDYLEQASDSGIIGFILYGVFVLGSTAVIGKRLWGMTDSTLLGAWMGLVGWALQSFVEFGFYIPAIAWPAFLLLGLLLGCVSRFRIDSPDRST